MLPGRITALETELNRLSFLGSLPLAKGYWQDSQHIIKAAKAGEQAGQKTIAAIEPYADVLGLKDWGSPKSRPGDRGADPPDFDCLCPIFQNNFHQ